MTDLPLEIHVLLELTRIVNSDGRMVPANVQRVLEYKKMLFDPLIEAEKAKAAESKPKGKAAA